MNVSTFLLELGNIAAKAGLKTYQYRRRQSKHY